ncbi:MAG: M13 family peptidase [Acidobacteria bacterium]|nr:MAG: M13 family peptidase [Acidobacteriota bacterium]
MSKRFFSIAGILAVVGVLALALAGAGLRASAGAANKANSWGFDSANLDRTCKPCDDFYQFAMGGWRKTNPIPPEYSSWGTFTELADKNQQNLRQILDDAVNAKAHTGGNEQKIGDFYASCMDTTAIEAAGTKPLEPEMARIAEIKTVGDLQAETERLQTRGVGALFRFSSNQDAKDSTRVIGGAFQGGLGLPEREYYLKEDEHSKQLREAYQKHVARMFELLGDPQDQSEAEAAAILKIETALATASMKNTDLRDPDKTYHKMMLADLQALTPNFSWEAYFKAAGHPELKEINLGQPDFFKALDAQLTSTAMEDWKNYLRWHLVEAAAPGLSEKFVAEDFEFRGKTLTGAKEIQPRWKRCVQATDRVLGEALGQVYVQKYFPPEAKARALEMVHNLVAALRDDLQTLPWMGPDTRAEATRKLEAFAVKIGYTDKWRDYSALPIDRSSYAENQLRGAEFEFARRLNKIGKPVDRTEWGMTPPTVNAYNNSSMKSRAACVSDQFDAYVVDGDLHENGQLVLGESIADLGGLTIAYAAYQKALQGKPRPPEKDGFSPEQRFFLGWLQVSGANERIEYARLMANTNPHPLPRFRGNGPLSNMAEFAKAFGCKKGQPMVREQACKIW